MQEGIAMKLMPGSICGWQWLLLVSATHLPQSGSTSHTYADT